MKVELFFFFLEHHVFFWTNRFSNQDGGWHLVKLVGRLKCSSVMDTSGQKLQDFKPHWLETVKTVCHIKTHGARGLAVGV
jgi:hypothetical protein